MALPTPEHPKPWEHRPSLEVDYEVVLDDNSANGSKAAGLVASCSCGDFAQKFPFGVDPNDVLDGITPHMESHPLPPHSIATLGDDSLVLVMAVPGPEGKPVHMSIGVSRDTFDDGKLLGHYLGTIGSPLHFQISEQRERIHSSMKSMGFSSIQMPQGVNGIERVVDMLRDLGHEVNQIGHISPDGSVKYIPISQPDGKPDYWEDERQEDLP
jgi:hypothetical protein